MKKSIIILLTALFLPVTTYGQATDPVRLGMYTYYDLSTRQAMEAQIAIISTMAVQNVWIRDNEDEIVDCKREFDKYLQEMHNAIALAAQIYGSFYEITEMSKNLKNLTEACQVSPTNILANAFKDKKRKIVENIVWTTSDLMKDFRKLISDKSRMTEAERLEVIDIARKKMKSINRQLRAMERNIRYYNLCDLWNDIMNEERPFRTKTNKEIAEEARDEWMNHYKLRMPE